MEMWWRRGVVRARRLGGQAGLARMRFRSTLWLRLQTHIPDRALRQACRLLYRYSKYQPLKMRTVAAIQQVTNESRFSVIGERNQQLKLDRHAARSHATYQFLDDDVGSASEHRVEVLYAVRSIFQ